MLEQVRESVPGPLARGPAGNREPHESTLRVIGMSNSDATAPRLTLGRIGQRAGAATGGQDAGSGPSPKQKGTPIEIPVHADGRQAWLQL